MDMCNLDPGIQQRLDAQELAVLATVDADQPFCSLVAIAVNKAANELVFITDRNSHKYINLIQNPNVCLLIDDRPTSNLPFGNSVAYTLFGTASEAKEGEFASLRTLFLSRHPTLKQFADRPNQALIKVIVSEIRTNSFPGV
jgi:nitroimidazol reductase NimA-like FMN-containing flavoprotein (pyridoxamine 5'-phosphate oxidase superfamily)